MGVSHSKTASCEPLRLCKDRKRYMKQAIDSRYELAAAHVVYAQSLQNIGIAIGKFAETEAARAAASVNYMISGGVNAATVHINPSKISNTNEVYVHDMESLPPPPPPPLPRFSWDYFDPTDGSFRLMRHDRVKHDQNAHCEDDHLSDTESHGSGLVMENDQTKPGPLSDSKDDCLTMDKTDDPLEVIPFGGRDFASSIKEIEDCFTRASKSGDEISRMLEVNKIQISYSEANGGSSGSSSSSLLTCFRGNALVLHEPQQTTKVITWKRSMSSSPSLLCLPGPSSTDDNKNNFIQEFCMIAGTHSSTLDRLYAWERKLYDEVKASESIRKEYDKKCDELRRQFAKDHKTHLIDKTRAAAKYLHSRMKVALHTVDSISKRIEKMRDEELQPQLMELIQGLMIMWKAMLECYHAQYTTIKSANHSRTRTNHTETNNHMIMVELEHDVECLGSAFSDLVKSYTSYVESINNWLQNCITQPKERVKGRRTFSPRRAVAPTIFIMCQDWSGGIRTLPSQKVSDVIKELLCNIRRLLVEEELKSKELSLNGNGEEKKITEWDLSMVDGSLTKVFDRLTNYCEESWTMYQDIKEKSETAGILYSNYRRPPSRASNV
ncbi:protein ALTERED PHOSPHATE STARVATION RESPONSE 1-like [Bidens hawaiensis]|uniref:protein ALTERED PHOSPHATE STARVATION RESPONSE 1-like n=1 Tax=Bidens hawaiensis TaxID=980011 RepID=UPI00404A306E